jgi:hypothetical protein
VVLGIVVFVLLQVGIPFIGLFGARPARFGWQMYSVSDAAPQAWIEAQDGTLTPLDISDRMAVLRADVRDASAIGRGLCAVEHVVAVIVELDRSAPVRVPCT